MNKKSGIVIFDGDDTLWTTQEIYDSSKEKFRNILKEQCIYEEETLKKFDALDAERVKTRGFLLERFFETMLVVYAMLCGKHKKKWEIEVERQLIEIGLEAFKSPKLHDDALHTIKELSSIFDLVLYTSGTKEIQEAKIDSFGDRFKSYFSKIYISSIKNGSELKKVLDDLNQPSKDIWVVGNSLKSDILPALEFELKCILIPRGNWKYDEDAEIEYKFKVANSLREAANAIMKESK
jgi:putative hydrolase of the HAD superfamily